MRMYLNQNFCPMKRMNVILLNLLVAASVVFLSSCKKDPDAPLPTIDFTSTPDASYAFNPGTSFKLGVKIYAPEKLKLVNVELIIAGCLPKALRTFQRKAVSPKRVLPTKLLWIFPFPTTGTQAPK